MNLASLSLPSVRRLLNDGLWIRSGPFVYRVHSNVPALAAGVRAAYWDASVDPLEFADFHVAVQSIRPIGKKRIAISVNGTQIFTDFATRAALAYLEWGMNACVYHRTSEYLAIHGATLAQGDQALLLVGQSGAGKSTLCAALSLSGWKLLSDEIGLLCPQSLMLRPLARPISLKNDSIEIVRQFASSPVPFAPLSYGTEKGTIGHFRAPHESETRPRPAWVVFVNYQPGATVQTDPVPKSSSFVEMAKASMNYGILGEAGFRALAQVVESAEFFRFTYSKLDDAVEFFGSPRFCDSRQESPAVASS